MGSLLDLQMRVFAGCPVPGQVATELAAWASERFSHPHLRFVSPENMHVTLFFFGSIDEPAVDQLTELTERVEWRPIAVTSRDIALFRQGALVLRLSTPDEVLHWLTYEKNNAETALGSMDRFCAELEKARGRGQSTRQLQLHVTFGRLKGRHRLRVPEQAPSLSFELSELVLYESTLTARGSVYRAITSSGAMKS